MTIPSNDFLLEVTALGFACWNPRDAQIYCPSEDWLVEFGDFLKANNLLSQRESWDCDDYALAAVTEASIACRSAALGSGHSFVYCTIRLWGALNGYDAPWGSLHACNLVRLDSGVYVFFEPQNGTFSDAKAAIDSLVARPANALL